MPELNFEVLGATAVPFSVSPLLAFKLRLTNSDPNEVVQSVALRCQIQIEVTHRKYDVAEQEGLVDLFGEPERWSRTLRSMLWTHATVAVPAFEGATEVELPVPCTFDFNVAATKYFAALKDGEVPLNLMFSGTVFYEPEDSGLQIAQIPWDREAKYRLPVSVWREMIEIHYPNSAWLCLRRDAFEMLSRYKMERGIPTWEAAIERLVSGSTDRSTKVDEAEIAIEGSLPS
jgi:hypothetical protein